LVTETETVQEAIDRDKLDQLSRRKGAEDIHGGFQHEDGEMVVGEMAHEFAGKWYPGSGHKELTISR
jgi:hypothetical protein